MVGLSLPLEAVASGAAPQLLPGSASLGCQGARPTPGSRDGLSGHDRASTVGLLCLAGLGLPCPAYLLYESPWVLDLRLGKGLHRPCPGCPPSPRRQPLGPAHSPAASWPYVGQTAGLALSVTPVMWAPWSQSRELPPDTQPKSSTCRLGRGSLGEPPSPGQGAARPTGCQGPGGAGPRPPAFERWPRPGGAVLDGGRASRRPPLSGALCPHHEPSSGPPWGTVSCS